MQRKTIYATAAFAAVVVMVAVAGWLAATPDAGTAFPGAGGFSLRSLSDAGTAADGSDEAGMSESGRREAHIESLLGELAALQKSPGNLQAFQQSLQRRCQGEAECQALLAEVLARHPDRDFAALVARTLARMPAYERAMQALVMATATPARERYDAIQALRDRTLGREEAALAFGQERAWADYQFAYGDLQQRAASMAPAERLAALEDLRARAFGTHAEALKAVEGRFGAYERELAVSLAGVDDAAARTAITRQLRDKHFDAETRRQLEARDTTLVQQQRQVTDYKAEEGRLKQELEGLRGTMSEPAWNALYEQRMTELRLRHFP